MGLEPFRRAGALLAEAGDAQLGYLPFQRWQSMTLARMGELERAAAHLHAGLVHSRRGYGDMNVLTRALAPPYPGLYQACQHGQANC